MLAWQRQQKFQVEEMNTMEKEKVFLSWRRVQNFFELFDKLLTLIPFEIRIIPVSIFVLLTIDHK